MPHATSHMSAISEPPRAVADDPIETHIRPRLPVDLRLTLGPVIGRGGTAAVDGRGVWWRAARTPAGPATMSLTPERGGFHARAWGPGAAWAIEAASALVGCQDSLDGFDPPPGIVRDVHRRLPGLRVGRSHLVFDALVPVVLAQKVTGLEAGRAWTGLVRAFGEPAPGPAGRTGPPGGLRVPPPAEALAALPYHSFHRFGVEMRRANVIRRSAAEAPRLERATDMTPSAGRLYLQRFPGIGPWTAAEVALVALGDADAVSVGDYHIPNTVSWAMAGEPRGTDERMLELLAPFEGHRGRVIRLLEAAGLTAPKFGPRSPVRSIRRL
jgi:3-methyladenine DNA glycosylase/8-oxoguanine DNA glycosylase